MDKLTYTDRYDIRDLMAPMRIGCLSSRDRMRILYSELYSSLGTVIQPHLNHLPFSDTSVIPKVCWETEPEPYLLA